MKTSRRSEGLLKGQERQHWQCGPSSLIIVKGPADPRPTKNHPWNSGLFHKAAPPGQFLLKALPVYWKSETLFMARLENWKKLQIWKISSLNLLGLTWNTIMCLRLMIDGVLWITIPPRYYWFLIIFHIHEFKKRTLVRSIWHNTIF